jgi:hypothetical protein
VAVDQCGFPAFADAFAVVVSADQYAVVVGCVKDLGQFLALLIKQRLLLDGGR